MERYEHKVVLITGGGISPAPLPGGCCPRAEKWR